MRGRFPYRVRARIATESWIDVEATTPEEAEREAAKAPGVISIFPHSAIRTDLRANMRTPMSIDDEDRDE